MSLGVLCAEEFKRDAATQIVDRGYSMLEVATRLGIGTKSHYDWKRRYHKPERQIRQEAVDAAEIRRLNVELSRVTKERDILKRPGCTSQEKPRKVRLYQSAPGPVPGAGDVPRASRAS